MTWKPSVNGKSGGRGCEGDVVDERESHEASEVGRASIRLPKTHHSLSARSSRGVDPCVAMMADRR